MQNAKCLTSTVDEQLQTMDTYCHKETVRYALRKESVVVG